MTLARTLAIAAVAASAFTSSALACTDKDWKACKGKPWVTGDTMDTPMGERWWPNKLWGAADEAGSTNWFTKPEVVQRALAEAKTGKTYRLGRPYSGAMPTFGERKFVLRIPGGPTGGPFGANALVYNDEFVATEIGQIGTQFDGMGHIGIAINGAADKSQIRYYNGVTQLEIEGASGLKKNGVEKLHPIVARGFLIDVAGAKGPTCATRWPNKAWPTSSSCPATVSSSAPAGACTGSRTTPSSTAASPASAWKWPSG
jgi:hypothetical protein